MKQAPLDAAADQGTESSASIRAPVVPLLATAHALAPSLLYGAMWLATRANQTVTLLAIALFWSWPVWLWPLLRHRHARPWSTAIALVISLLVLAAVALPIYILMLCVGSHVIMFPFAAGPCSKPGMCCES